MPCYGTRAGAQHRWKVIFSVWKFNIRVSTNNERRAVLLNMHTQLCYSFLYNYLVSLHSHVPGNGDDKWSPCSREIWVGSKTRPTLCRRLQFIDGAHLHAQTLICRDDSGNSWLEYRRLCGMITHTHTHTHTHTQTHIHMLNLHIRNKRHGPTAYAEVKPSHSIRQPASELSNWETPDEYNETSVLCTR